MNFPYFLESDHYVPNQLLDKIDTVSKSIAENGLQKFYMSMDIFMRNFIKQKILNDEVDESEALTLVQLKRPLMLVFILWTVAIIIHLMQMIVLKIKNALHVWISTLNPVNTLLILWSVEIILIKCW